MDKTRNYFGYFYIAVLLAILIYGLIILFGNRLLVTDVVETVVIKKILPSVVEANNDEELDSIVPEDYLEGWGPV